FYEMALGRLPFRCDNVADALRAQLSDVPARPSTLWADIPLELDGLIMQMLEKDPLQRPTLAAVRDVIETVRRTLPPEERMNGPTTGAPLPARRTPSPSGLQRGSGTPLLSPSAVSTWKARPRWRLVGVIAGVLAVAALGVFLWARSPEPKLAAPPTASGTSSQASEPAASSGPGRPTMAIKISVNVNAHIELDGEVLAEGSDG